MNNKEGYNNIRYFHSTPNIKAIESFKLTDIGEGIAQVELIDWKVQEGNMIGEFDEICEVQSDKANVTITSPFEGKITKLYYKQGDIIKTGAVLMDIDRVGADNVVSEDNQVNNEQQNKTQENKHEDDSSSYHMIQGRNGERKILATPSVRRIAKENSINLSTVKATGSNGRILKEDILLHVEELKNPKPTQTARSEPPKSSSPTQNTSELERVEPIRGVTRAMVDSMTKSASIPLFGYKDEIEMDHLIHLRKQLKEESERRGIRLTFMPFLIKATSLALKRYPILNSSLNSDVTQIIYKNYHNISFAVDSPNGLVVPNIKDVQNKSIFEIAQEMNRIIESATQNKLSNDDIKGGTFTLSNIGNIGGTYLFPVVFSPQVCIGAVGKTRKLPRFDKNDNVIPVNIMNISWSADHRIVDGATVGRFSNLWKSYIEKPTTMIMEMK